MKLLIHSQTFYQARDYVTMLRFKLNMSVKETTAVRLDLIYPKQQRAEFIIKPKLAMILFLYKT